MLRFYLFEAFSGENKNGYLKAVGDEQFTKFSYCSFIKKLPYSAVLYRKNSTIIYILIRIEAK